MPRHDLTGPSTHLERWFVPIAVEGGLGDELRFAGEAFGGRHGRQVKARDLLVGGGEYGRLGGRARYPVVSPGQADGRDEVGYINDSDGEVVREALVDQPGAATTANLIERSPIDQRQRLGEIG